MNFSTISQVIYHIPQAFTTADYRFLIIFGNGRRLWYFQFVANYLRFFQGSRMVILSVFNSKPRLLFLKILRSKVWFLRIFSQIFIKVFAKVGREILCFLWHENEFSVNLCCVARLPSSCFALRHAKSAITQITVEWYHRNIARLHLLSQITPRHPSHAPLHSAYFCKQKKSTDSKPDGLPSVALAKDGGRNRTRICDLHDVNVAL